MARALRISRSSARSSSSATSRPVAGRWPARMRARATAWRSRPTSARGRPSTTRSSSSPSSTPTRTSATSPCCRPPRPTAGSRCRPASEGVGPVTTHHRRLLALAALVLLVLALAGAVAIAVTGFPRGLLTIGFVAIAVPLALWGAVRRGARRGLALSVAALLVAAAVVLLVVVGPVLGELGVIFATAVGVALSRAAFVVPAQLPPAPRPRRPVLFWNPRSGGGKAAKAHLPDEARARGIEPVELRPGDDLRDLVRAAVSDGADALAMAGGDGSQAVVAAM